MTKDDERAIKAIDELHRLLTEAGIEHEVVREQEIYHMYNQIRIYMQDDFFYSAICHYGSYGYGSGTIEVYNFFEEPTGCLTPQQAFEILITWVKGWKKHDT